MVSDAGQYAAFDRFNVRRVGAEFPAPGRPGRYVGSRMGCCALRNVR